MSVSITEISFEHHRPAFGIAETQPRISWKFEGTTTDWEQTSYDIEITRDGTPKVFSNNSSESILVPWPDVALSSAESATVRTRSYGKEGQPTTDWSSHSTVETGLLSSEDWQSAVPIAADHETEVDGPKQPVLFRKGFSISNASSARLYITALGLYEAEINGKRVGDHVLAPGYQSYQFRHVYDTYDVTSLLTAGDNTIGVTVGEGCVTQSDGSKQTVKSDLSWQADTGPIITSEIYDGEVYNASLALKEWTTPAFDDSNWLAVKELPAPKGSLVPADGSPIKRREERKPEKVFLSDSGKTVVDFGQNLVGWLRVKVDGPGGTNITFVHTEVMENGEVATRPLRSAKARDTILLSGNGTLTWEPKFTYHGFRYVQVTGWPNSTTLGGDSITAIVVHSDMERTGYFESSHETLNRFHENVVWSMKGNFLGVPTDCPQRDERLGWTGDAHAFMPTANYLYDASGFWRGWLKDAWSEQKLNDVFIPPYYIPSDDITDTDRGRVRTPTAVWGDVVVGNPWALYQTTGDSQMLEDQYVGAQAWIDKGISRNEVGLWNRSTFQFSDWLDPLAPTDDAGAATTHKHLVADAYLIHVTDLLTNMSTALGKTEEANKYASQRSDLVNAFHEAWIAPYDIIANVTQTALALGIQFDIFNSSERSTAAETLRKVISDNNYLVGTGFAGTQQLGFALTSINATSDFYKMLLQTSVPSWLYQVVMGGTTTWERWDSLLPNGSVNPGSMTSFNHYAFGSVADWVHQKIGGIAPAEPGWKTVRVAPEPGGNITSAKAEYLSPYGWVNASWAVDASGLSLEVSIPPNSRADVVLPGNETVTKVGSAFIIFRSESNLT
ncbi:alfa-L-rhamnosidase [Lophiotrema nucula]|uniref:alpha-L-rhamnosidase n=1 Tax=Lophiotrema nucula TaxID=690887 RepID=A0A6A5Z3V4_9PLEO|nr:alfa-L-rhamnosidase [Lophiotrema nucula]